MRNITICSILILTGCVSVPTYKSKSTYQQAQTSCIQKTALSVNDHTIQRLNLVNLKRLNKKYFEINNKTCQLVNYGDYKSASIAFELNEKRNNTLVINSQVVKSKDKKFYLFYPVITTLDSKYEKIQEILPKYEFQFKDNVLTNTFKLPESTKYILVHTKPEFTGMTFDESTVRYESANKLSGLAVALAVVGGAAGGAVGGAINADNSYVQQRSDTFTFSNAGAIKVMD
ncbi:hypothetical protein [Parashewanella tropica]|uniref:hypothetical protein n=1 Tax=Parashewanella tropica TaxID=2547970 RepID=UPI001059DBF5|nr:hypothetical protein [Parashewanella tropica]